MTDAEFRSWLDEEVRNERMSSKAGADLLKQKEHFDREFPADEPDRRTAFHLKIVGFVADHRVVGDEVHALVDAVKRDHPGRLLYFEPIGFDLFEAIGMPDNLFPPAPTAQITGLIMTGRRAATSGAPGLL